MRGHPVPLCDCSRPFTTQACWDARIRNLAIAPIDAYSSMVELAEATACERLVGSIWDVF